MMDRLRDINWEPVPFALKNNKNLPTKYGRYFHQHPAGGDLVLYQDRPTSIFEKLAIAKSVIYDGQARKAARHAIRENDCRIVYGLQVAHYLYPEIVLAAKDCKVPVVLRLSDFQLLCPSYSMFRDNAPCELCLNGLHHSLKHRCMKGSLPITATRVAAMRLQRFLKVNQATDMFICPSFFMATILNKIGIPKNKLIHLPTPISHELFNLKPKPIPNKGYALYVGGLYEPKGVLTAVKSAIKFGFPLKIVGQAGTPVFALLEKEIACAKASNITFTGFAHGPELDKLYKGATCVLVPSLWYENSPNVILEAMAHGRPVVASNIGSLPETVADNETGFLFKPGDEIDLYEKVKALIDNHTLASRLGNAGAVKVREEHSIKKHLGRLGPLFEGLL